MKTLHPNLGAALLEIKRVMLGLARHDEQLVFGLRVRADGHVELSEQAPDATAPAGSP